MKYRPSAAEEYISTLPENLQIEAMKAVVDEGNRIRNGPWTAEEIMTKKMVQNMARAANNKMESIVASCFQIN